MPARRQRAAGAVLALVAGAAMTAQSPAPQSHPLPPVPHPHASGYGHGPGYGPNGMRPQVYVNGILVVPASAAPSKTPQAKPTKRPAGAEDVFETHSSTDAQ